MSDPRSDLENTSSTAPAHRFPNWISHLRHPQQNERGIRALQFVPFYVVAGTLLFLLLWTIASLVFPAGASMLWGDFAARAIFAVAAVAPAFAIASVEGRSFDDYGLAGKLAFGKSFWAGSMWGVISLSVLLLSVRVLGDLDFSGIVLHGARVWKFGAFWAVFFFLVAVFEEFAFRGYVLFSLARAIGFWPAAVLLSIGFGVTHVFNPGENWFGSFGAGAIGLFFCFTLRRTGNLWFAVGLHAFWDWGESFLYGVPDSGAVEPGHLLQTTLHGARWLTGGSVGPEGSVLVLILIVLMWVLFDRMYPAKRTPKS